MVECRSVALLTAIAVIGCTGHRPPLNPVSDRAYGTDVRMLPAAIRFRSDPGEMTVKLRAPVYLTAIELTPRHDAFRVVYSSSNESSDPLSGYVDVGLAALAQVSRGRITETRGNSSATGQAPDCRSMQQPTDRPEAFYNSDCQTYNLSWRFGRTVLLVTTSAPWRPEPDARGTDWLVTFRAPPGVIGEWAVVPVAPSAAKPAFVQRSQ